MKDGFDLKEELKKLPDSPGVYLMHDKNDRKGDQTQTAGKLVFSSHEQPKPED